MELLARASGAEQGVLAAGALLTTGLPSSSHVASAVRILPFMDDASSSTHSPGGGTTLPNFWLRPLSVQRRGPCGASVGAHMTTASSSFSAQPAASGTLSPTDWAGSATREAWKTSWSSAEEASSQPLFLPTTIIGPNVAVQQAEAGVDCQRGAGKTRDCAGSCAQVCSGMLLMALLN